MTAAAKSAVPEADRLKVVGLKRQHVEGVQALLRATYGERYYGADERYFRWLYLDNPCAWFAPLAAGGAIPVNGLLDSGGAVVAVHAYVPFDARTPWGGKRGIWDVDWINGSGIRGAGRRVAARTLADADIYVGYGYGDLSETAFRKMRLTLVPEIPRRVWLMDRTGLGHLVRTAGFATRANRLPAPSRPTVAPWHRLPDTGAILDAVLVDHIRTTPFGVDRSRPWLAWRYDRHPYIRYTVVAADIEGASGVAVVRLEQIKNSNRLVCRIVDFLDISGHESALLAAVLGFARDHSCLLVDYFTTSTERAARFDAWAERTGTPPLKNPPVPFMFQPIAYSNVDSINLVIAAGGHAPAGAIDLRRFHATKADSNQDISRDSFTGGHLLSHA